MNMERITAGLPVAKGTFIDVQTEYPVSEKLQTLEETLIQPLNEPESIQRILDLPVNEETADNIIRDLEALVLAPIIYWTFRGKNIIFRHGGENLVGSSFVNFRLLDWYPRSVLRTEFPQALCKYFNFETTGSAFHAKSHRMNRPSSVGGHFFNNLPLLFSIRIVIPEMAEYFIDDGRAYSAED